jgi:hypothetical protein
MLVPMKGLGAMTGPATLTGQGTLREEERTSRTSRTGMYLLGRVSTAHLHLVRTTYHPMKVPRCSTAWACLRRHHHLVLLVGHQTTNLKCQTHRQATTLVLTTSKVLLPTKADLLGTKVVTKVTRGTQAQLTLVPTLDTKVVPRVTKVSLTKEATPTQTPTKVVAILATAVAHQSTQAREATKTTNEL